MKNYYILVGGEMIACLDREDVRQQAARNFPGQVGYWRVEKGYEALVLTAEGA